MGGIDGGGEQIISLVGRPVSSPRLPSLTCLLLSLQQTTLISITRARQLPPLLDTGPPLCLALGFDWLVLWLLPVCVHQCSGSFWVNPPD